MREHPVTASYILADLELPPIVKQMARSHHERFDGNGLSGWPHGRGDSSGRADPQRSPTRSTP